MGGLLTAVLAVPGCGPEGVESAPKMKGSKDEIQKAGSELPVTPKGESSARRGRRR